MYHHKTITWCILLIYSVFIVCWMSSGVCYPVLRTAKEGKCLSIDLIRGQFKGQSQCIAPKQNNTKEIECAGFICRTRLLQITLNNAPLTRCHCVWKQHRRGEPPVARLWPASGEWLGGSGPAATSVRGPAWSTSADTHRRRHQRIALAELGQ